MSGLETEGGKKHNERGKVGSLATYNTIEREIEPCAAKDYVRRGRDTAVYTYTSREGRRRRVLVLLLTPPNPKLFLE